MDSFPITDGTIVDLLVYFAERFASGERIEHPDAEVKRLVEAGYSPKQVEEAFQLARQKLAQRKRRSEAIRVFSEEELSHFTPQAKALFLKLSQLGILSNEEIELVLMRAQMSSEEPLDEDELKLAVAMLLGVGEVPPPSGIFILGKDENVH